MKLSGAFSVVMLSWAEDEAQLAIQVKPLSTVQSPLDMVTGPAMA